jgi:tetratricopeptide (TPR) repeat protein
MKKLLLIVILLATSLSYCQTAEEYLKRGIYKDSLRDDKGAIADYTKAVEINSNYMDAYFLRGLSKHNLEDYHGAIAYFTKALKINPWD